MRELLNIFSRFINIFLASKTVLREICLHKPITCIGPHLKQLDILRVVVGGPGLPLEEVVVFEDAVMDPGGQRGQCQGPWTWSKSGY